MYGYVTANKDELKVKELVAYNAWYCGLCDSLNKSYGKLARLTINHDMTFLIFILNGVYDKPEEKFEGRCLLHPMNKRLFIKNEISGYAADMNILLAWYKMIDDWEDEKKLKARMMLTGLRRAFKKVREQYPEKTKKISREFKRLKKYEKADEKDIDKVSSCFGNIMSQIFIYKNDEWTDALGAIGFYIGKFIYIMDAYEDMKEDEKNGNYNCLLHHRDTFENEEKFDDFICSLLDAIMAECAHAFEILPIVDHSELLRNIIYAGIWDKWDKMHETKAEEQNPEN